MTPLALVVLVVVVSVGWFLREILAVRRTP